MAVRLIRAYNGQAANTIYAMGWTSTWDAATESVLLATGGASSNSLDAATDYVGYNRYQQGLRLNAGGLPNAQIQTGTEILGRVKRTMAKYLDNNAYSLPAAIPSGATVAISATSDTTIATRLPFASGNVLSSTVLNNIASYGGVVTPAGGTFLVFPVIDYAPGSGSIAALAYAGLPSTRSAWTASQEVMTDAANVELEVYINNTRKVFIEINGRITTFSGYTGLQAGNTSNFIKISGLVGVNRIRWFVGPSGNGTASLPVALRIDALSSIWKPSQIDVLRMSWSGDSYGEGLVDAFLSPIHPMAQVAGFQLGIRDVRQVVAGGCGILATNTGTRPSLRYQIPFWLPSQGPFDLHVFADGINDFSFAPADVQSEMLACLQLARSLSAAPIVVLGSQAGARGPDSATIATENAIKAAVVQFNDPLCKFAPVSTDTPTWLNGTGYVGATNGTGNSDFYISNADGVHIHPTGPSATKNGHEYLGNRAAIAIRNAIQSM